jgi:septum formation protein
MRLILASASPRRAQLLSDAGIAFDVVPAEIDETPFDGEAPGEYVVRVARDKARHVASKRDDRQAPILAADTVVVSDGRLFGKPSSAADAREMLKALSGAVHEVQTGVVLLTGGREFADVVSTRVHVVVLSDREIDWYLGTAEPEGKAGAYAIQGKASRFIDWIDGSWSNVVGLPVATVYQFLKQSGVVS